MAGIFDFLLSPALHASIAVVERHGRGFHGVLKADGFSIQTRSICDV